MSDMTEITAEMREQRAQADADALRRARHAGPTLYDLRGNAFTPAQVRAELEASERQAAEIAAYAAQRAIARDLEQRQLAAEQETRARAEADARQEQVKQDLKRYWVTERNLYKSDEFDRVWAHGDRASLAAGVPENSNERLLAQKRAELGGL